MPLFSSRKDVTSVARLKKATIKTTGKKIILDKVPRSEQEKLITLVGKVELELLVLRDCFVAAEDTRRIIKQLQKNTLIKVCLLQLLRMR